MANQNLVVNIVEGIALLFLGILAVLAFSHLLNGTFGSWMYNKTHMSKANIDEK